MKKKPYKNEFKRRIEIKLFVFNRKKNLVQKQDFIPNYHLLNQILTLQDKQVCFKIKIVVIASEINGEI